MTDICEVVTVPNLETVIRLHRRNHGRALTRTQVQAITRRNRRRDMGLFKRPSMEDRMDGAEERQFRRRQSEAELLIEQTEAKHHDHLAAQQRRAHEDRQPYQGSRLEAEHRARGQ